jgi:hypothetical protein
LSGSESSAVHISRIVIVSNSSSIIEHAVTRKDLDHDCNAFLDLRQRIKGGQIAYAYQCQCCGRAVGNEVSKKLVLNPVPLFDDRLHVIYEEKLSSLLAKELSDHSRHEFFMSDKHTAKTEFTERLDILRSDIAQKYPHANVSDIFKQYISKAISNLNYSDQTEWQSEEHLKDWFRSNMSRWFTVFEEVPGTMNINGQMTNVRIDFILVARPELVDAGFTPDPIGVEVKHFKMMFDCGLNFSGKLSKGIYQAISYAHPSFRWQIRGEETPLVAVMLFSPYSFQKERQILKSIPDRGYWSTLFSMLQVASHANVGEIQISRNWSRNFRVRFQVGGSTYADIYRGQLVRKPHDDLIGKFRVGNIS